MCTTAPLPSGHLSTMKNIMLMMFIPVVVMFSIMMMISPSYTQRSSLKWYFLKNYAVFHHHAYEVFDYDDEHDDNFHDGDDDGPCSL